MPDDKPSLPPPEQQELEELRAKDKRTFSIDLDKKVLTILATLVLGTGGYGGYNLVTEAQMKKEIAASEEKQSEKVEVVKDEVKKNTGAIEGLTATIGDVQEVQHMDIAVREARRVVDEQVKCRRGDDGCHDRKVRDLERVRRTNMKRLKAKPPLEPCASLACN